jgi:hypothetical protein
VELVRRYPDRIAYVHTKAFDQSITREAHEHDWPFGEAAARRGRPLRRRERSAAGHGRGGRWRDAGGFLAG